MIFGSSPFSQLSPDAMVPESPPLLTRSGTTHWKGAAPEEDRLDSRSEKFEMCEHCSLKSAK